LSKARMLTYLVIRGRWWMSAFGLRSEGLLMALSASSESCS